VERVDGGGGGRRAEMGEDGFSESKHVCAKARRRRRRRRQRRYLRLSTCSMEPGAL
jgi:hypothetical protein